MNEYDAINDEIKNFLTLADKQPEKGSAMANVLKAERGDVSSLIDILTGLQNVYNEINANLAAGDNEGVKNTLLNSEIKMSLVSESLMRVLKDVCQEKNELVQSEGKYKERIRKIEGEKEGLEIKMSRMESDLEFANRGNQELSRMIKDQKSKIQGFKEKADLEKRNCDSFRSINAELETLRRKALEKCDVYQKEIEILKGHVQDRMDDVRRMKEDFKRVEEEKEGLSRRVIGMEKSGEILRKKLEMKENALVLCNSELSKLLSKERRMDGECEGLKEKASYYERLYKATNAQNEYLNNQLARMISGGMDKMEEGNKASNGVSENKSDVRGSEKSYLKRLRRYKRKSSEQGEMNEKYKAEVRELGMVVERLKDEVNRLQEENGRIVGGSSKMTDELMGKVEGLLEKNREYQTIIYGLRGEKLKEEWKKDDVDESFRTVNDGDEWRIKENLNARDDFRGGDFRPFTLLNDYERDADNDGVGSHGFNLKRVSRNVGNIQSRLNGKDEEKDVEKEPERECMRLNIPDGFYSSLAKQEMNVGDELASSGKNLYPVDPFDSKPNEGINEEKESSSTVSPKTVKTTSTFHEMLRKADALRERFDRLEGRLNVIKNSDKADAEKVHDQIKEYKNYYYSDYLDMSNGCDFI